jgi:hypothetical protein
MICRICTVNEKYNNGIFSPLKSQFANNVDRISQQGDSGFYVAYRNARNGRNKALYTLWRHSTVSIAANLKTSVGLYAIFTAKGKKDELEASPLNGIRLKAYEKQTTHAWRYFQADGTDSSINPVTGSPVGDFSNQIVKLASQPPNKVNNKNPLVDTDHPTCSITKLTVAMPVSLGAIELLGIAQNENDADDDPSENEEHD